MNPERSLGIQTILIGTPRLCRNEDFAMITQMPLNIHIMGNIYTEMANCYVKKNS